MTRQEIERRFHFERGEISSISPFIGEAAYCPYFAELSGEELEWPDAAPTRLVRIEGQDRAEWPELKGADYAKLWRDDAGFWYCRLLTSDEEMRLRAEYESAWDLRLA